MKVSRIQVKNFRSYKDTGLLGVGSINLLVGPNNAGKSTLLRAIHLLQQGNGVGRKEIRIGETVLEVLFAADAFVSLDGSVKADQAEISILLRLERAQNTERWQRSLLAESSNHEFSEFQAKEPNHVIVPLYSQRKTRSYAEQTNTTSTRDVTDNFSSLTAKLARLSNPTYPGHEKYKELCKAILGSPLFTTDSDNGQMAGNYVGESIINVSSMGDGVPHVAGLLAALVNAKGKIFLLEEPENDLHPAALKAILELIVECSTENQFFITTHSNIVVRHLGAEPDSKLFRVRTESDSTIPTSVVEHVENTTQARIEILRELGYALADFELSEGWLVLEESSAECIIREFLIPEFAPELASLQTISAGGADKVKPTFDDFMRLALYGHLQQPYRSRTWVRMDGDDKGEKTVQNLRTSYSDWPDDRFKLFSKPQFEHYYPSQFSEDVQRVFAISDRRLKREAKHGLLQDVLKWLREDRGRAARELAVSAADVIEDLKAIAVQLRATSRARVA